MPWSHRSPLDPALAASAADRPYHHGALRSATLEAGRRLLARASEEDLSLREIAREVGVTAPSVYRHFPDKAALLRALSSQGLEELGQAQRDADAAAGGGREGFVAMGEAYVRFAVDNPALFRLIFSHPPQHDLMDRDWGGVSAAMVLLLDASANFAADDAEARSLALHSWALVHGLAMLVLDQQVPYDPAAIHDAICAGTGVRPSGASRT